MTMKVYLMRHGEAAWTAPDQDRCLTERGVQISRAVLQQDDLFQNFTRILCSPYRRARQTAEEAERLCGLEACLHDCLTPDESPDYTLEDLTPYVQDGTLIVAHQPLLGSLVGLLTEGTIARGYPFSTSEIVVLELEMWASGCGRLLKTLNDRLG